MEGEWHRMKQHPSHPVSVMKQPRLREEFKPLNSIGFI